VDDYKKRFVKLTCYDVWKKIYTEIIEQRKEKIKAILK
jgi:hypothetical protein